MLEGFPHPDYLLPELTSRQLAEWTAFYNRNPFGQEITNLVIAKMAAALWNQRRGKGVEAVKPEDFLPKYIERQTPEEMKLALRRHLP